MVVVRKHVRVRDDHVAGELVLLGLLSTAHAGPQLDREFGDHSIADADMRNVYHVYLHDEAYADSVLVNEYGAGPVIELLHTRLDILARLRSRRIQLTHAL